MVHHMLNSLVSWQGVGIELTNNDAPFMGQTFFLVCFDAHVHVIHRHVFVCEHIGHNAVAHKQVHLVKGLYNSWLCWLSCIAHRLTDGGMDVVVFDDLLQDQIDVYFGTFAKAMATIGAFVVSEAHVIEFLRYNMRSQIYAKSLPMLLVEGALKRLDMLRSQPELKDNLWKIVHALRKGLHENGFSTGKSNSPVTPVVLNGTIGEAAALSMDLRENFGIFCSVVIYPVVPKGMIILRLIPTAMHTLEDVDLTIKAFAAVKEKLTSGVYKNSALALSFGE